MKAGPEIRIVVSVRAPQPERRASTRSHGPFDLIFCRNVLIYFDLPSKTRVVARLLDHLAPGGYLFLGHRRDATGINDRS